MLLMFVGRCQELGVVGELAEFLVVSFGELPEVSWVSS
jgi:hypothetical protein